MTAHTDIRAAAPYIEFRIDLVDDGQSVTVRVDGPSAEVVVLACTSLTGFIDDTVRAVCGPLLEQRGLRGAGDLDDAIHEHIHTVFSPPLTGRMSVDVDAGGLWHAATITVTTTSLGAMIGALFIHFSGAVERVRQTIELGLDGDESGGMVLTTNIR